MVEFDPDGVYHNLAEDYGLEHILNQNDKEEWEVLAWLFRTGFLDLSEYIFDELEDLDDED
ncbi:MAG: hypothetical protein QQN63_10790 [Nitrosopumilus sp.]